MQPPPILNEPSIDYIGFVGLVAGQRLKATAGGRRATMEESVRSGLSVQDLAEIQRGCERVLVQREINRRLGRPQ